MLRRTPLRLSAAALTVVVGGLASAPAMAAGTATGTAAALQGSLAGMTVDSGRYTATNDGSGEQNGGTQNPAMLPSGQNTLNEGVLVQDAATTSKGGDLGSLACAGLAGKNAAVVPLGDTGVDCKGTADTVSLSAGSVDLSGIEASDSNITSQLPSQLQTLAKGLDLDALRDQLNGALTAFGNPALSLNLDAVQASCSATPDDLTGTSNFANAALVATPPDMEPVTLFKFDSDPDPNTPVSVTLANLGEELSDSLRDSLEAGSATGGPLAGVFGGLPDGLTQAKLITAAVKAGAKQFSDALAPVLTGTVNKQSKTDDSIHVTAFDGEVLPAASSAIGSSLAALQIGDVTCSRGTVEVDAPSASPSASGSASPVTVDAVPTAVDSGQAGEQSPVLPIVGGLLLLAGAGVGVRRFWLTRG